MIAPGHPHFGRCPCTGVYERRTVEVRMTVAGEALVLSNVPQGLCPTCGSRIYKSAVLQEIERAMRGPTSGQG